MFITSVLITYTQKMTTIQEPPAFEARNEEDSDTKKKFARSLSPKQIIFIILGFVIIYYLTWVKKSLDKTTGLVFMVALAVIAYLITLKSEETDFIPIDEVWKILLVEIKKMQYVFHNIPQGSVELMPLFNMHHIDKEMFMWYIGIKIKNPNSDNEYTFIARVDPRKGRFLGMTYSPKGYKGEVPDIIYKDTIASKFAREKGYLPALRKGVR